MLETEIKKLTAALEANTLALLGGAAPAKAAPAAAAKPAPAAAPAAPAAAPVPDPEPTTAAPASDVTMKDITAKILELGKSKGRQAAVQLLGEFGAAKVPDLKKDPSKFGEIVAKIDGLLAA